MNIKEKIGKRIAEARKQAGLTIKELADLTHNLKPARIGNWEQGTRTPGPQEVMQLATALNIPAAYLLCLTDEIDEQQKLMGMVALIPLLSFEQARYPKKTIEKLLERGLEKSAEFDRIHVAKNIAANMSPYTFALVIEDESMTPEFKPGDVIILDPDKKPIPGHYVVAYVEQGKNVVFRKYRERDTLKGGSICFELVPINTDWRTTIVSGKNKGVIIGAMVEFRRYYA